MGFQPEWCGTYTPAHLEQIRGLALSCSPKVVAIGEIGLDYYWEENPPGNCSSGASGTIWPLARELDLPVIVHDREAHGDSLAIVREFPGVRGGVPLLFRQCGGRQDPGEAGLEPELYRGGHLKKRPEGPGGGGGPCPADRIMLETDSPIWLRSPTGENATTAATWCTSGTRSPPLGGFARSWRNRPPATPCAFWHSGWDREKRRTSGLNRKSFAFEREKEGGICHSCLVPWERYYHIQKNTAKS